MLGGAIEPEKDAAVDEMSEIAIGYVDSIDVVDPGAEAEVTVKLGAGEALAMPEGQEKRVVFVKGYGAKEIVTVIVRFGGSVKADIPVPAGLGVVELNATGYGGECDVIVGPLHSSEKPVPVDPSGFVEFSPVGYGILETLVDEIMHPETLGEGENPIPINPVESTVEVRLGIG